MKILHLKSPMEVHDPPKPHLLYVLDTTGNIKIAQEILGHSHLSTTADLYLRVDQHAMVTALERVKANTRRCKKHRSGPSAKAAQYVFE